MLQHLCSPSVWTLHFVAFLFKARELGLLWAVSLYRAEKALPTMVSNQLCDMTEGGVLLWLHHFMEELRVLFFKPGGAQEAFRVEALTVCRTHAAPHLSLLFAIQ